ncbi:MAG: hypothetical protein HYR95_02690 [Candidatus Colwellbacteria bacterium]|nr:hypothetical protein [Candidatus Colwellbacteria bacterium]
MNKIYVAKSDTALAVIEKVIKAPEAEASLYIPKNSLISTSRNNFKLLKREAKSAGKILTIESVDDDVLELAESFGFKAVNTFFGKRKSMVDIIAKDSDVISAPIVEIKPDKAGKDGIKSEYEEDAATPQRGKFSFMKVVMVVFLVGLSTGIIAFAAFALPKANVSLALEEINWDFAGTLLVGSKTQTASFADNQIRLPGVIFSETKNVTKLYVATGTKNVQKNSKGTVTIYNAFNAESQALVKNTRLSAPDGKIWKTDKAIVVPGAKITNGKVTPSGVDVTVTAEKPGPDYNVGPIPKFRIPGFQGSPRYEGFYGVSLQPMAGGFSGVTKVPTDADIKKAKEDIETVLRASLKTATFLELPPDIKILNNASDWSITREQIDDVADSQGKFSVTAYGEIKTIGFKENDLIGVLANKLISESKIDLTLRKKSFNYDDTRLDFKRGEMSSSLNFTSIWARPFDVEKFKSSIAGKNETEIKTVVYAIPGFKSGGVKLWPLWVMRAPNNSGKITVDVEYKL